MRERNLAIAVLVVSALLGLFLPLMSLLPCDRSNYGTFAGRGYKPLRWDTTQFTWRVGESVDDPLFSGDTYLFEFSEGTLPPGVTLRSSGWFEGTPEKAGRYDVILRACLLRWRGVVESTRSEAALTFLVE